MDLTESMAPPEIAGPTTSLTGLQKEAPASSTSKGLPIQVSESTSAALADTKPLFQILRCKHSNSSIHTGKPQLRSTHSDSLVDASQMVLSFSRRTWRVLSLVTFTGSIAT